MSITGMDSLEQQFPGPAQAHLQVVALRHAVEVAPEQALDLAPGEPGRVGDPLQRQRLLDVLLHQLRDPDHVALRAAHLGPQRHVLPVLVAADPFEQELFRTPAVKSATHASTG